MRKLKIARRKYFAQLDVLRIYECDQSEVIRFSDACNTPPVPEALTLIGDRARNRQQWLLIHKMSKGSLTSFLPMFDGTYQDWGSVSRNELWIYIKKQLIISRLMGRDIQYLHWDDDNISEFTAALESNLIHLRPDANGKLCLAGPLHGRKGGAYLWVVRTGRNNYIWAEQQ